MDGISNSENVNTGPIDTGGGHAIFGNENSITYHINGVEHKIQRILSEKGASIPADFLGRETELNEIRQRITTGNLLMLVNGEGGIGKTTLATAYWQKHQQDYKHLAWLYCDKGILGAIRNKLVVPMGLAEQMQQEPDPQEQLALIKTALANLDKDCLLVLDNANDAAQIAEFRKNFDGLDWHILITSRCHKVLSDEYYINHLPEPLAKELFHKYYTENIPAFQSMLSRFLKAVGYNTLCIEIFSKHLREAAALGENMQSFLQHLEQKGLYLEENSFEVRTEFTQQKNATTDEFLNVLYDLSLLDEPERYLLVSLSLLPAENHAMLFLLELFLPQSKPAFKRQLDKLAKKGWLFTDTQTYRISPVVQQLFLQKNRERLWEQGEKLVRNLNNKLETNNGFLVHLSEIQAEPFAAVALNVLANLKVENSDVISLYNKLESFYFLVGNLGQSLNCAIRVNAISSRIDDNNGLAISYEKMGDTYTLLGNLDQALSFFEKCNGLMEDLFAISLINENFKKKWAVSYYKLGYTHTLLGHLDQALSFFEKYNQLMKELFETSPANVDFKNGLALSCSKLGETYKSLGNLDRALSFFENYNQWMKELFETSATNVDFKNGLALSYYNLGDIYLLLGNLDQALSFLEKCNQLMKELFEVSSTNVTFKNGLALSCSKLGDTHKSLGNLGQALSFLEKYNQCMKELSEVSPTNVEFKNNLAESYFKLGEFHKDKSKDKARVLFQHAEKLWVVLISGSSQIVEFQRSLTQVRERLADL